MADQGMDVLLTVDQNLRYQQNPDELGVAVVVLVAETNRLEHLTPLIPATLTMLNQIRSGNVIEVSASS